MGDILVGTTKANGHGRRHSPKLVFKRLMVTSILTLIQHH
jgi:hypothetical protein